jgi:hypothetical protein
LRNTRQEKFCTGVVLENLSAYDSYAAAGYTPSRQNAYKLRNRDYIELRIRELTEEQNKIHAAAVEKAVEAKGVTLEGLIEQAQEIQRLAIEDKAWGAAVSSLKEVGTLSGLRVERRDSKVEQVNNIADLDDFEMVEMRVTLTLKMAEGLNLDPATTTLDQFCDALLDAFEREMEGEEPPAQYRHMPPLPDSARGNRAPHYRELKREPKPLTRGEAARLNRTASTNGSSRNGSR